MNALRILGLAVILACMTTAANAQDGVAYPYGGCWFWYGYDSVAYSSLPLPYYSLHPPVYYSYRVARTYGYSPFAYPPGVMTPGREPSRSAVLQNVSSGEAGETPAGRPEGPQPPLRIDNPFVERSDKRARADRPWPSGQRPQVVFPLATAQNAARADAF